MQTDESVATAEAVETAGPGSAATGLEGSQPPTSGASPADLQPPATSEQPGDQPPGTSAATASPPSPTTDAGPTSPELPEQEPWGFRVDGVRVDPPGSYRTRDGKLVIPYETWERELQPNFLAHRPTINRQINQLKQQIAALGDDTRPEILRAKTAYDRLNAILEMDPLERDQAIEQLRADLPRIQMQAELDAAKNKAKVYETEVEERQQAEVFQAIKPILEEQLVAYCKQALTDPQLAGLDLDPLDMARGLIRQYGGLTELFLDVDPEKGQRGHFETPHGEIAYNLERINSFLLDRGEVVRRTKESTTTKMEAEIKALKEQLAAVTRANGVAKQNAEVLAPNPEVPPVVPAAVPVGASSGSLPKWRDPALTYEQQREAYAEHQRKQGLW